MILAFPSTPQVTIFLPYTTVFLSDGQLILNIGEDAFLYADGIAEVEVQFLRTDSTLDMLFIYEINEEEEE